MGYFLDIKNVCIPLFNPENNDHSEDYANGWNDAVRFVYYIPRVEVEPVRHGRWEDCSNGWMCSECNRDSTYDTKYCPHCGAKMDLEDSYGT